MFPVVGLPLAAAFATPPVLVVTQAGGVGTYPTIQEAVDAATVPGTRIEIHDGGLFEETVTLTTALTVVGIGVQPVLRAGTPGADDGVFRVDALALDVVFENLRFDGDSASRAMRIHRGRVQVIDCVLEHHHETGSGGTITVDASTTTRLDLIGSTFSDSVADSDGGFVSMPDGTMVVTGCSFTLGEADSGGAIFMLDGTLTVFDSTFVDNASLEDGGAIYSAAGLTVSDSVFRTNAAVGGGRSGGAIAQEGGSATFIRDLLCDNEAAADGGGIYLSETSATVLNSVFVRNAAGEDGGAILSRSASVEVGHDSLVANTAASGEALSGDGSMAVRDTYVGHHSGSAAVRSVSSGNVLADYSGFSDNSADLDGNVDDLGTNQFGGANVPLPPLGSCDPADLAPPVGSDLIGNASDGTDIGALDGTNTWPDGDSDGSVSIVDCDDADPAIHPGAAEIPGDEVDQDCDGTELCFQDDDDDGFGDPANPLPSSDADCDDPDEFTVATDVCAGFDDANNLDQDAFPDGCDECDVDAAPYDNVDDDGVCNAEDICHGFDDDLDSDGDGTPNGCDDCVDEDSDGDEVPDDCDLCPEHDDRKDRDGDGNPDDCDDCPDDNPNDTDGDEVCDTDDRCPGSDDRADDDGDGIANGADPDGPCDIPAPPRNVAVPLAPSAGTGCGCGTTEVDGVWIAVLLAVATSRRRGGSSACSARGAPSGSTS